MEEMAVFGDIHAKLPALETVSADMAARGPAENLYCLGDLGGLPAHGLMIPTMCASLSEI